jgi:hypothetical protein
MAARVKSGGIDFYKARCSVLEGELEELRAVLRGADEVWDEKYRALAETVRRLEEKFEEVKFQADQAVELRRQVFVLEAAFAAQTQAHTTVVLDLAARTKDIR